MEPIELGRVVADAIEMASPLLEERGHRLGTFIPPGGLRVNADAERLAQVVANLLTNAAKYTPPHGAVTVTAARRGQAVELEVKDEGIGIDPALLPRVFDLFTQGRQASDRPNGGLGLGLAIARNLAAMHGGSLRAESPGLGRGSVFTLELPLLSTDVTDWSPPAKLHEIARIVRRILVVDDNSDAADAVGEYFMALGHEIRVAHDGVSALAVASEFRPDVALLDLGLPVMDGYELAGRLTELFAEHPPKLVAVTGYGDDVDRRRSRQAGFSHHLVKPVDLAVLSALIEPK
jgi:CheY-like chemotaxis protein